MWAIFASLLFTGLIIGFEFRSGDTLDPTKVFVSFVESVVHYIPALSSVLPNLEFAVIVVGVVNLAIIIVSVLFYKFLGILSAVATSIGAVMIPFGDVITAIGVLLVFGGGFIAMYLDPDGYLRQFGK